MPHLGRRLLLLGIVAGLALAAADDEPLDGSVDDPLEDVYDGAAPKAAPVPVTADATPPPKQDAAVEVDKVVAPRKNKKTNVTDTMPDYIKGNPKAREMHEAIHRPDLDHATTHHENGTEVERYEFHSELVYADPKRPHGVFVYRTLKDDKVTRGLPSCAAVDGWYLSINRLPFWPIQNVPTGLPLVAAKCDYDFVDWPDDKHIFEEVPEEFGDYVVVFSKEKPDDELYWKTELEAAEKEVMKQEL